MVQWHGHTASSADYLVCLGTLQALELTGKPCGPGTHVLHGPDQTGYRSSCVQVSEELPGNVTCQRLDEDSRCTCAVSAMC